MKVKEWKKLFEDLDDELEVSAYIFNFEYDDEFPEDMGVGKVLEIEKGCDCAYLNIGLHK